MLPAAMASLKVTVTTVFVATPVAPLAGDTLLTVGGVVSEVGGRVIFTEALLPAETLPAASVTVAVTAMAAPSAVAKDPWRFVVIRKRKTLSAIAAALPNGGMLAAAPLGIVVCGDLDAAHDRQLSYLLQDCSAAIENLLLCVHALGLGACWLGVHPRDDRIRKIKEILQLTWMTLKYLVQKKAFSSSRTK